MSPAEEVPLWNQVDIKHWRAFNAKRVDAFPTLTIELRKGVRKENLLFEGRRQ
jgi:hypothetical protein